MTDIQELTPGLMKMCNDGHELLAYHLIVHLRNRLTCVQFANKQEVFAFMNKNLTRPVVNTFSKRILKMDLIDYDILSSLLLKNKKKIGEFLHMNLKIHVTDPDKFMMMAYLGCKLSKHLQTNQYAYCKYVLIANCWWNKIDRSKANYNDYINKINPMKLLEYLIDNELIETDQLQIYCNDFNVSLENCYVLRLKKLICDWKPVYSIIDKPTFGKVLIIHNDEDELYESCMEIINKISSSMSVEVLKDVYNEVNHYYYEVYLCILRVLNFLENESDVNAKEGLLNFLKTYTRVSPLSPSEYLQDSFHSQDLAQFRLPYVETFFTSKVFNFIKKEINIDTYKIWLDLLPILNDHLTTDDICLEALKSIVSKNKKS